MAQKMVGIFGLHATPLAVLVLHQCDSLAIPKRLDKISNLSLIRLAKILHFFLMPLYCSLGKVMLRRGRFGIYPWRRGRDFNPFSTT